MLLTKMQVFSGTVTKQNKHVSHQRFYTLVGTLKLSQTSPDVPNSEGGAHKDLPNAHSQQQVTPRSVSSVCVCFSFKSVSADVFVAKFRGKVGNKNRSEL